MKFLPYNVWESLCLLDSGILSKLAVIVKFFPIEMLQNWRPSTWRGNVPCSRRWSGSIPGSCAHWHCGSLIIRVELATHAAPAAWITLSPRQASPSHFHGKEPKCHLFSVLPMLASPGAGLLQWVLTSRGLCRSV